MITSICVNGIIIIITITLVAFVFYFVCMHFAVFLSLVVLTLPPSVSRLSRENVRASTSHNRMGLHGLLQGQLYFFYLLIVLTLYNN
jgi:hypothetical protein